MSLRVMRRSGLVAALAVGLCAANHGAGQGSELAPPVPIVAGSETIDVDVGHAAPFVCDMDGDGVKDLLVGQFGQGKLRVYRNVGTNRQPRFEGFEWFQAAGADATVPSG